MAKVKFRTAMSALKKGGKACYQCVPVLENKVTEAGFLAEVAVIAGGNLPERSQWNPSDGNSFLTKVVDAGGETLFDGREILDEDLGPATSSPSASGPRPTAAARTRRRATSSPSPRRCPRKACRPTSRRPLPLTGKRSPVRFPVQRR